MRTFRTQSGPFSEGVHYTSQDIELTCEDELRKVGLLPDTPKAIRIDRFIEKRFGVVPVYEDLKPGILGFTRFGPSGVEAIVITRSLSEEGTTTADSRLNSTLAHEAGHGLFHAPLIALGSIPRGLFADDGPGDDRPKILCRDDQVHGRARARRYDGRWWEFQANQAIGALLLPRALVLAALADVTQASGSFGILRLAAARRREGIQILSETFEVNPIVAEIRIQDLFPSEAETQGTL